jgi:hypothetical protein
MMEFTAEDVKERLREMVPDCAERFAPVYRALNWQWGCDESNRIVPGKIDISDALFRLINAVELPGWTRSGGLVVGYDKDSNEAYIRFEDERVHYYEPYDKFVNNEEAAARAALKLAGVK